MARRWLVPPTVLIALIGAGIGLLARHEPQPDARGTEFTRIAFAFAQHKPDEVDAYFGPASLRPAPNVSGIPLAVLSQRAHRLVALLESSPDADARWE
jgi:hypothetical protein